MNCKERLMSTMRGEAVDRPAVSFYDLNGLLPAQDDPDPFNIANDPSWRELYKLTQEKTDRIVSSGLTFIDRPPSPMEDLCSVDESMDENGSRHVRTTIKAGSRTLTSHARQDRDVYTIWTLEHLLKDVEDFKAWIDLPEEESFGVFDPEPALAIEEQLAGSGVAMLDTADPLCCVAPMFDMATYTIIAMTENELMHRALEKALRMLQPMIESAAKALPGRLWRIYGPEYASPPYLPPHLFEEYVTRYVTPLVETIQRHGGFVRLHSHGRLRDILEHIVATGCDGLDPIEPPPTQGDVELQYVREKYGEQLVLFGNLEMSDIETTPTDIFSGIVEKALDEGTAGNGRGFVLMPSASPYGRKLQPLTQRNYERIIEIVESRY